MHRQLHWLDVVDRVNYKIGLLVYKCLHGLARGFNLSDQCIPASTFAGRANMRSSTSLDRLLYVPQTKTKTLGPRGFYYAASAVWNSRESGITQVHRERLLQNKTEISLFHS